MQNAVVLGAGMVGSVMAVDMARAGGFEVAVADVNEAALEKAAARARQAGAELRTINADLSDPASVRRVVEPADIVLGAGASRLGFATLRAVIEAGRNYCDISFMSEDALELDSLAKEQGVTAVVDCGVAPGMSNLLAGYGRAKLDRCENIEIYVGGLPRERRWPFEYKAGFSPADVIEEYTRPSRIVEHGKIVQREALSEPELMDFEGVGTLEAFNTDGLRSLAYTMDAPFMKEKTLRYPGHIELMRVLRAMGLFDHESIEVGGAHVRPIDVTSRLMFPMWTYEEGEEDLTVMRIIVEGERAGEKRRFVWDLLDFYDRESRATSMARTTAFPCAIVARMIAAGEVSETGVLAPEKLGAMPGVTERVLEELERRGVRFSGPGA
ncbi:MAG: saccharopine dehydrogenase [Phycisphaeraceae bacterium]|nr:MAG: saccharopine dehydrogenase [Phycisphaeraceae bacterium]